VRSSGGLSSATDASGIQGCAKRCAALANEHWDGGGHELITPSYKDMLAREEPDAGQRRPSAGPGPKRRIAMATYVALINWTDQGVKGFKESVDRYEAAQSQLSSMGVRFTDVYWTLGAHDIVGIIEAPDDQTLAAALLTVAGQGNIRTTTLRAFSLDQMRGVIRKAG
jgi:uncharacterized protein with GYD domain